MDAIHNVIFIFRIILKNKFFYLIRSIMIAFINYNFVVLHFEQHKMTTLTILILFGRYHSCLMFHYNATVVILLIQLVCMCTSLDSFIICNLFLCFICAVFNIGGRYLFVTQHVTKQ